MAKVTIKKETWDAIPETDEFGEDMALCTLTLKRAWDKKDKNNEPTAGFICLDAKRNALVFLGVAELKKLAKRTPAAVTVGAAGVYPNVDKFQFGRLDKKLVATANA